MKVYDIRIGQAVQIGDVAVVKLKDKAGARIKLAIATQLPLLLLADGLIPARFTTGISGDERRVPVPGNEGVAFAGV